MAFITLSNVGSMGVIKDLSEHEIPVNAWTDAQNIRFFNGYVYQGFGEEEIFAGSTIEPQHLFPVYVAGVSYWIYLGAATAFAVTAASGTPVHTDISHATPLTGVVGNWTNAMLGGIPIINSGLVGEPPAAWDLNLANNFIDLSNWPANYSCKSIRAFKNVLVALNVNDGTTDFPHLVKWSHPADPGALPSTWDHTSATNLAGQYPIAEGYDHVIDGLQLRDSFIVYKQDTTWLMYFVGGVQIFGFRKLFEHGILSRNCAIEYNGLHFVVTRNDVVIHDGSSAIPILEQKVRRYFFDDLDPDGLEKVFVAKNPYMNEIYICYPSGGFTTCNKALIYNINDKTASFRALPDINHAQMGFIFSNISEAWEDDNDSWESDITIWNKGDSMPVQSSVAMAGSDGKLYQLDGSASSGGANLDAYVERKGLHFDKPDSVKLVRGIRPKITGSAGTVIVKIGYSDNPYEEPTYTSMTYTIGETIQCDCFVSGRYLAIRFESGTATEWRLDSYQIDLEIAGDW